MGISNKILGESRHFFAKGLSKCSSIANRKILARSETMDVCSNSRTKHNRYGILEWDSKHWIHGLDILRSGVVRLDGLYCLDLDYGARAALLGWYGRTLEVRNAAVLWSHFWTGYYHWILDVLPKLCALKAALGDDFSDLKLCYPFWDQPFEKETFDLLNIPASQRVNTKCYRNIRVLHQLRAFMLPGWYRIHPNARLAREMLIDFGTESPYSRIYLERTGRRRCLNEPEVKQALEQRGFVSIPDQPRSLVKQIGLFRKARVIVAPHGAALANLLWCEPGATVVEFFGSGYHPDFYKNLAEFNGLHYARLVETEDATSHWTGMAQDFRVDLVQLISILNKVENSRHSSLSP